MSIQKTYVSIEIFYRIKQKTITVSAQIKKLEICKYL